MAEGVPVGRGVRVGFGVKVRVGVGLIVGVYLGDVGDGGALVGETPGTGLISAGVPTRTLSAGKNPSTWEQAVMVIAKKNVIRNRILPIILVVGVSRGYHTAFDRCCQI